MKVSYFARYGKNFNVSRIEKSLKGQRCFSENIGDLDYRLSLQCPEDRITNYNTIDIYICHECILEIIDILNDIDNGLYKKKSICVENIVEPKDRKYYRLFIRTETRFLGLIPKKLKLHVDLTFSKNNKDDMLVITPRIGYKLFFKIHRPLTIQPFEIEMGRIDVADFIKTLYSMIDRI